MDANRPHREQPMLLVEEGLEVIQGRADLHCSLEGAKSPLKLLSPPNIIRPITFVARRHRVEYGDAKAEGEYHRSWSNTSSTVREHVLLRA